MGLALGTRNQSTQPSYQVETEEMSCNLRLEAK